MPKRKVGAGEGTGSLAKKNGFFWRTIWEHPENAELRNKRKDPNVLHKDDEIFIPEKQNKEVSKSSDAEHTFKRRGEPGKIKIQLLKLGQPRANEDYVFDVGGTLIEGTTDGDGRLEHFISGEVKSGKLILQGGKEIKPVRIGFLDPLEEIVGVQQRLKNLGYNCAESKKNDEKTKAALKKFQADYQLEVSGEIDEATKAKLKEISK